MFPSFNPAGAGAATATVNVARCDSNNVNEKTNSDSRKSRAEKLSRFYDGLVLFTRMWGVLTAIVIGGVGVDLAFHKHRLGYYLIGGSIFIFISEVTWVVTLFLHICVRSDSRIRRCWTLVTCFSGWKKFIIYGAMGTVPVIFPHKLWLSYVAGVQLLVLALLHLILSFKWGKSRRRKNRLLSVEADSFESSRFEEITECLDDGLPEPIPGSSYSIADTLLEQDTVLEI